MVAFTLTQVFQIKQLTILSAVLVKIKAQQIYYRALTDYLSSNSDFQDAKDALHQSALNLYDEETANEIEKAWEDVGV